MTPEESTKNIILVIDDEEEFREAAVRLATPLLPKDWEIEAPSTLDEAMQIIHERIVRIVLIDRNISGDGYQPLSSDKIEVETTSGIQIASWLKRDFPNVRRIAFSKGGLGCAQLNGHVETKFQLKQHLNQADHTGEEARNDFRNFIATEIEYAINGRAAIETPFHQS